MSTAEHPADLYAAVRDELLDALCSISAEQATAIVPSCPSWTVKEVVAHTCGLNAEFLAGVSGSLGSHEATTRQVHDRSSLSLSDVLGEWSSMADDIDERFRSDTAKATALLADLVIHVFDLSEVLKQDTAAAAAATPISAHRYVGLLQSRVAELVAVGLTVELDDDTHWPSPEFSDALALVTVQTSPHDFLRGVTGRLARAEVEAFHWSADPTSILDQAWNQYGPFRAED